MKKLTILMAFALALILGVSVASAIEYTNYTAGIQVQNLSNDTATIMFSFYDEATGNAAGSLSDTIAGNSSSTYFPIDGISSGFDGSAVISSDKPIAAIVNVLGDTVNGGSYSSFSEGFEVVSLPLVANNFVGDIDTWFNVQNAGSADVDITISYSDKPTCNETATIKSGAAKTFNQASNTCLGDGYIGAATISTVGGSIVATAMEVGSNGLYAYNGFGIGSPDIVMPLVIANLSVGSSVFDTGVQIQNQGNASTNVTVTYTPVPGFGTQCTETKSIPAKGAATFFLNAFLAPQSANTTCALGQTFVGSASVTTNSGNENLVGIVNQTNFSTQGSAYGSFRPSDATDTVLMPLVLDAFGIFSGFNVMNVGGDTTVTCTFSDTNATFNVTETLANGAVMNDVQLGKGFPANAGGSNYVGSATCTATGTGKLLAVVNQNNTAGTGDVVLTYEGFSQ